MNIPPSPYARMRMIGILFAIASAAIVLPAQDSTPVADASQTVQLDPFKVSTVADQGYRAGNSVSATRVDTPIKDLPFTVTALTEQFIKDINGTSLLEVLRYAPGVSGASTDFTSGNANYVINGFAQAPQRNGLPGTYSIVDPLNVERIEIVSGPASLLYGQIAPGGTVNYITKTPRDKAFADVTLQVGSWSFLRSQVDINTPLIDDKLYFRFNGMAENWFQYVKPSETRDFEIAPTMKWKTTKTSELTVSYEWYHRRETPQIFKKVDLFTAGGLDLGFQPLASILPDTFNLMSYTDYRRSDQSQINVDWHAKLNDHWDFRTNYQWANQRIDEIYTGLSIVNELPNGTIPNPLPLPRRVRYQYDADQNNTYQAEVVGTYDFGFMKWQPLFGFYYLDGTQHDVQRVLPVSQYPPAWNLYDPSTWNRNTYFIPSQLSLLTETYTDRKNTAYYTAQTLHFFHDRLIAVGGVRKSKADSHTTYPAGKPQFSNQTTTSQIGVGYKVLPDMMLYASYSESFLPIAQLLRVHGLPVNPAAPMTGKGYEAGIKTDFLYGRVSSTISVFDITQQNIVQTYNFVDQATSQPYQDDVQSGSARSKGAKFEFTISPMNNWQVFLSGTYDHAYVESSPANSSLVGTPLQYSTKYLASLWTRYNFPTGGLKGLYVAGGPTYTGPKGFVGASNPNILLAGYTLWNAVVGYDGTWRSYRYTFTANFQNLTNKQYDDSNYGRGMPGRVVGSLTLHF